MTLDLPVVSQRALVPGVLHVVVVGTADAAHRRLLEIAAAAAHPAAAPSGRPRLSLVAVHRPLGPGGSALWHLGVLAVGRG